MMNRLLLYIIIGIFWIKPILGQIPSIGVSDRLDVATWNIEWFGDVKNGPSNEELQLDNVVKLIHALDLDIIALQEISDINHWNRLLDKCPQYKGVISTWSQTQKTGLLFKVEEFDFAYQKHILSNYDYDFASGRLPLEVGLIPKHRSWKDDTLRVWVLHMKANTGTSTQKIQAYNRRYNAALALKMYVDGLPKGHKGLVLGDWNDDFDQSILTGYATPFPSWIKDTLYAVCTFPLSIARENSTVSYAEMIDHIVCTPGLKSRWIADSSMVLPAGQWVNNYGNTTSDHYPVYSRFHWEAPLLNRIPYPTITDFRIKYVSGEVIFTWEADADTDTLLEISLYDFGGSLIKNTRGATLSNLDFCKGYIFELKHPALGHRRGLFILQDNGTVSYR